jgi:hypothetical protein
MFYNLQNSPWPARAVQPAKYTETKTKAIVSPIMIALLVGSFWLKALKQKLMQGGYLSSPLIWFLINN